MEHHREGGEVRRPGRAGALATHLPKGYPPSLQDSRRIGLPTPTTMHFVDIRPAT